MHCSRREFPDMAMCNHMATVGSTHLKINCSKMVPFPRKGYFYGMQLFPAPHPGGNHSKWHAGASLDGMLTSRVISVLQATVQTLLLPLLLLLLLSAQLCWLMLATHELTHLHPSVEGLHSRNTVLVAGLPHPEGGKWLLKRGNHGVQLQTAPDSVMSACVSE